MVYVDYLSKKMLIHPVWEAQIALLLAKKVTVLAKYLDFADIFSNKLAAELFKCFAINEHSIDLESDK